MGMKNHHFEVTQRIIDGTSHFVIAIETQTSFGHSAIIRCVVCDELCVSHADYISHRSHANHIQSVNEKYSELANTFYAPLSSDRNPFRIRGGPLWTLSSLRDVSTKAASVNMQLTQEPLTRLLHHSREALRSGLHPFTRDESQRIWLKQAETLPPLSMAALLQPVVERLSRHAFATPRLLTTAEDFLTPINSVTNTQETTVTWRRSRDRDTGMHPRPVSRASGEDHPYYRFYTSVCMILSRCCIGHPVEQSSATSQTSTAQASVAQASATIGATRNQIQPPPTTRPHLPTDSHTTTGNTPATHTRKSHSITSHSTSPLKPPPTEAAQPWEALAAKLGMHVESPSSEPASSPATDTRTRNQTQSQSRSTRSRNVDAHASNNPAGKGNISKSTGLLSSFGYAIIEEADAAEEPPVDVDGTFERSSRGGRSGNPTGKTGQMDSQASVLIPNVDRSLTEADGSRGQARLPPQQPSVAPSTTSPSPHLSRHLDEGGNTDSRLLVARVTAAAVTAMVRVVAHTLAPVPAVTTITTTDSQRTPQQLVNDTTTVCHAYFTTDLPANNSKRSGPPPTPVSSMLPSPSSKLSSLLPTLPLRTSLTAPLTTPASVILIPSIGMLCQVDVDASDRDQDALRILGNDFAALDGGSSLGSESPLGSDPTPWSGECGAALAGTDMRSLLLSEWLYSQVFTMVYPTILGLSQQAAAALSPENPDREQEQRFSEFMTRSLLLATRLHCFSVRVVLPMSTDAVNIDNFSSYLAKSREQLSSFCSTIPQLPEITLGNDISLPAWMCQYVYPLQAQYGTRNPTHTQIPDFLKPFFPQNIPNPPISQKSFVFCLACGELIPATAALAHIVVHVLNACNLFKATPRTKTGGTSSLLIPLFQSFFEYHQQYTRLQSDSAMKDVIPAPPLGDLFSQLSTHADKMDDVTVNSASHLGLISLSLLLHTLPSDIVHPFHQFLPLCAKILPNLYFPGISSKIPKPIFPPSSLWPSLPSVFAQIPFLPALAAILPSLPPSHARILAYITHCSLLLARMARRTVNTFAAAIETRATRAACITNALLSEVQLRKIPQDVSSHGKYRSGSGDAKAVDAGRGGAISGEFIRGDVVCGGCNGRLVQTVLTIRCDGNSDFISQIGKDGQSGNEFPEYEGEIPDIMGDNASSGLETNSNVTKMSSSDIELRPGTLVWLKLPSLWLSNTTNTVDQRDNRRALHQNVDDISSLLPTKSDYMCCSQMSAHPCALNSIWEKVKTPHFPVSVEETHHYSVPNSVSHPLWPILSNTVLSPDAVILQTERSPHPSPLHSDGDVYTGAETAKSVQGILQAAASLISCISGNVSGNVVAENSEPPKSECNCLFRQSSRSQTTMLETTIVAMRRRFSSSDIESGTACFVCPASQVQELSVAVTMPIHLSEVLSRQSWTKMCAKSGEDRDHTGKSRSFRADDRNSRLDVFIGPDTTIYQRELTAIRVLLATGGVSLRPSQYNAAHSLSQHLSLASRAALRPFIVARYKQHDHDMEMTVLPSISAFMSPHVTRYLDTMPLQAVWTGLVLLMRETIECSGFLPEIPGIIPTFSRIDPLASDTELRRSVYCSYFDTFMKHVSEQLFTTSYIDVLASEPPADSPSSIAPNSQCDARGDSSLHISSLWRQPLPTEQQQVSLYTTYHSNVIALRIDFTITIGSSL